MDQREVKSEAKKVSERLATYTMYLLFGSVAAIGIAFLARLINVDSHILRL